jgi:hypothetical protein
MTELLIVKAGEDYYRFTDGEIVSCSMSKASVFPLAQLAEARACRDQLQKRGVPAQLFKLTIVEEPYNA